MSCLAHIERMPVEATSRPPKNSVRCGGLIDRVDADLEAVDARAR